MVLCIPLIFSRKLRSLLGILFLLLVGIAGAQDVQLYTEDFESGGLSFSLNGGGPGSNTGNSQWIINNQYNGGGTFPNTTLQNVTAGGTIGFAPQSNYLHIHDAPSGVTNNNYVNTTSADRFAYMTSGICTFGLQDVHLSFFFLCEGSPSAFGNLYYSADGGPWTVIGLPQYANSSVWQYQDITDPAFSDVGSLQFGFRWQQTAISGSAPATQSFAIDDLNIVATYSTTNPVTISVTNIQPNPVCQGSFLSFQFELSDTLCDGNYQIQLSSATGSFPGPFGSWVTSLAYPQTTGAATIQLPANAAPGDCYRIRVSRTSPPPVIQGIASACFEIIECPNQITTMQPVVTLDTNAVCVGSAIDVPFFSTGIYANNNNYIAQLSNADGTFPASPQVIGSSPDNENYDPQLGDLPGSVSGLVPAAEPGCNYFIRVVSTNPVAIGSSWGPFCIQECDITTNNTEDIYFCVNDCDVDPDGESQVIDIDVNSFDNIADYLPGNEFTTQLLSAQTFGQIGPDGLLGSVEAISNTQLNLRIPCNDSLDFYGIPLGMNYLRIVATESTVPENALGSLVRLTIGAYRNEPQQITSYEFPTFIPKNVFCVGETAVLLFSPYQFSDNSTFMWTCNGINGGQPFESPSGANSNSLYVILGAPGTLTFSIQETNNSCVSAWTPVYEITVLGPPNINISGPGNVCVEDTLMFQVPFIPNTYYSWDTNSLSDIITYQDTANNVLNMSVLGTGSYTFSLSVLNQCGSDSDTHTITLIQPPQANAGPDQLVCTGDLVTLTTVAANNYDYEWWTDEGYIGEDNPQEAVVDEPTSFIVFVTGQANCQNSDTVFVDVAYPDAPVVYTDSLCPGGLNSTTLYADEAGTYLWEDGSTDNFLAVSDTGSYSLSIDVPGQLCPRQLEFDVLPLLPDPPTVYTDSICPGGMNALDLSADGPGTYLWSSGEDEYTITVNNPGTYELGIYSTGQPCPRMVQFIVQPDEPDPAVPFADSLCPNGSQLLYLTAPQPGFYNWSNGENTYQIAVGDTGIYQLEVFGLSPCPFFYTYTVTADTCIVPQEVSFYVPNAFTPGNDALNEAFGPVFSDVSQLEKYRMVIFNRWGEVVFESEDPGQKWFGNVKGGDYYAKDEVYIWLLNFRQSGFVDEREMSGHVTILR
ncbi:MAG: gliding motility-associated C-terminal domain-containing protein [Flavobacteriales bacterium]